MSSRSTCFALAFALLCAPAFGQSNVRPAPRLVRVPEMGAELLARPRSTTWKLRPRSWERLTPAVPPDPFASDFAHLSALPTPKEPADFTHFEVQGVLHDNADFEKGGGDVAIARGGWSGVFGRRIGEETVLAVSLDAEASFYDFSGAQALMAGSGDPFNDVYDSRVGLAVLGDPTASQSWFAGMELGFSGEDDVDLRSALSVGALGGMRVRFDDDFAVSMGLAARSRLEDDPWLFPFLGFDWRVSERMRLVSEGSRMHAVYAASEAVELSLGAAYAIRQYRLNDDSPLPEGVVQEEEITAEGGLRWELGRKLRLELTGGIAVWREFQTYDDFGRKLAELETDPAPFAGFVLSVAL